MEEGQTHDDQSLIRGKEDSDLDFLPLEDDKVTNENKL